MVIPKRVRIETPSTPPTWLLLPPSAKTVSQVLIALLSKLQLPTTPSDLILHDTPLHPSEDSSVIRDGDTLHICPRGLAISSTLFFRRVPSAERAGGNAEQAELEDESRNGEAEFVKGDGNCENTKRNFSFGVPAVGKIFSFRKCQGGNSSSEGKKKSESAIALKDGRNAEKADNVDSRKSLNGDQRGAGKGKGDGNRKGNVILNRDGRSADGWNHACVEAGMTRKKLGGFKDAVSVDPILRVNAMGAAPSPQHSLKDMPPERPDGGGMDTSIPDDARKGKGGETLSSPEECLVLGVSNASRTFDEGVLKPVLSTTSSHSLIAKPNVKPGLPFSTPGFEKHLRIETASGCDVCVVTPGFSGRPHFCKPSTKSLACNVTPLSLLGIESVQKKNPEDVSDVDESVDGIALETMGLESAHNDTVKEEVGQRIKFVVASEDVKQCRKRKHSHLGDDLPSENEDEFTEAGGGAGYSGGPAGIEGGVKKTGKSKRKLSADAKRRRNVRNRRREKRRKLEARKASGLTKQKVTENGHPPVCDDTRQVERCPLIVPSLPLDLSKRGDEARLSSEIQPVLPEFGGSFRELSNADPENNLFAPPAEVHGGSYRTNDFATSKPRFEMHFAGIKPSKPNEVPALPPVSHPLKKKLSGERSKGKGKGKQRPIGMALGSVSAALRMARSNGVLGLDAKNGSGSEVKMHDVKLHRKECIDENDTYFSAASKPHYAGKRSKQGRSSRKRRLTKRKSVYLNEKQHNETIFVGLESDSNLPLPPPNALHFLNTSTENCPEETTKYETGYANNPETTHHANAEDGDISSKHGEESHSTQQLAYMHEGNINDKEIIHETKKGSKNGEDCATWALRHEERFASRGIADNPIPCEERKDGYHFEDKVAGEERCTSLSEQHAAVDSRNKIPQDSAVLISEEPSNVQGVKSYICQESLDISRKQCSGIDDSLSRCLEPEEIAKSVSEGKHGGADAQRKCSADANDVTMGRTGTSEDKSMEQRISIAVGEGRTCTDAANDTKMGEAETCQEESAQRLVSIPVEMSKPRTGHNYLSSPVLANQSYGIIASGEQYNRTNLCRTSLLVGRGITNTRPKRDNIGESSKGSAMVESLKDLEDKQKENGGSAVRVVSPRKAGSLIQENETRHPFQHVSTFGKESPRSEKKPVLSLRQQLVTKASARRAGKESVDDILQMECEKVLRKSPVSEPNESARLTRQEQDKDKFSPTKIGQPTVKNPQSNAEDTQSAVDPQEEKNIDVQNGSKKGLVNYSDSSSEDIPCRVIPDEPHDEEIQPGQSNEDEPDFPDDQLLTADRSHDVSRNQQDQVSQPRASATSSQEGYARSADPTLSGENPPALTIDADFRTNMVQALTGASVALKQFYKRV